MSIIDVNKINFDLLPDDEDEYYEYKSSLIRHNELSAKLQKAVSGFANSGGSFFVVGVGVDDKTGNADGGIPQLVNNTRPLIDWVDTIISQVEPTPIYSVKLLHEVGQRGFLKESCVVLVVAIQESNIGPHMSTDQRYYIRAGRHTVPARHFIVEAIRAKRFNSKPKLSHVFRLKPGYEQVLQLGIVSITNSPAINVSLFLDPLPEILQKQANDFPIKIPLIDMQHPFFFDVALYFKSKDSFGDNVKLNIEYYDLLQNCYEEDLSIGVSSTPPIVIGNRDKKYLEALNSIEKAIAKIIAPSK